LRHGREVEFAGQRQHRQATVVLLPDDEIHGRANLSEHRCALTS
jgi:hypothetical protein